MCRVKQGFSSSALKMFWLATKQQNWLSLNLCFHGNTQGFWRPDSGAAGSLFHVEEEATEWILPHWDFTTTRLVRTSTRQQSHCFNVVEPPEGALCSYTGKIMVEVDLKSFAFWGGGGSIFLEQCVFRVWITWFIAFYFCFVSCSKVFDSFFSRRNMFKIVLIYNF